MGRTIDNELESGTFVTQRFDRDRAGTPVN
jgi:hypothetical protein